MSFQVKIRASIFITIFVSTVFACQLFQKESEKTPKQGYYAIQPETILEALAHSKNKVFSPVTEKNIDYSVPPTGPSVNWTQSDYFYIVGAFYRLVLNDKLDDWHLNSMDFSLSCADVDVGLQDGRFEFFKTITSENKQKIRLSRFIEVDPRYKVVSLREREFYPEVMNWSSIDLKNIKFDSQKVLRLAEDSGGRNQRLSCNNACDITLSLSPDSADYHGWSASYTRSDNNRSAFDVNIDPFNGDVH